MSESAVNPSPHASPTRSGFRRSLAAGVAFALLAGAFVQTLPSLTAHGTEAVAAPAPAEPATPVPVATVAPRPVVLWDEFSGRLEAG